MALSSVVGAAAFNYCIITYTELINDHCCDKCLEHTCQLHGAIAPTAKTSGCDAVIFVPQASENSAWSNISKWTNTQVQNCLVSVSECTKNHLALLRPDLLGEFTVLPQISRLDLWGKVRKRGRGRERRGRKWVKRKERKGRNIKGQSRNT